MAASYPIRDVLVCHGCGADFPNLRMQKRPKCPHCGKVKEARIRRGRSEDGPKQRAALARLHEMARANPERQKAKAKTVNERNRRRVFFMVCKSVHPKCVRCGCDDARLLEINHKNGGGAKELGKRGIRGGVFYRAIRNGTRATDDLELLCKPCNAIHALEMKFGPLPMKVVWRGLSQEIAAITSGR